MSRGPGDSLSDTKILGDTTQELNGGNVRLTYVLPSGQETKSEWIPQEKLKGRVLIGWCQGVKDAVNADAQWMADEEARRRSQSSGASTATPDTERPTAPSAPSGDPDEYIKAQLTAAVAEVTAANTNLRLAKERWKEAEDSLYKWNKIAEQLGITLGEESDESDSES